MVWTEGKRAPRDALPAKALADDFRSGQPIRRVQLPTDEQPILPGQRYYDEHGEAMWTTVTKLLAKLEARTA